MYIVKLLRFLRGYVRFIARSGSIERFINLCAHHHIPTWGGRKTENVFSGYTSVNGYKGMHRLARKAGVRTRVTERHGLPFILHRYQKRIGVAAGVLLFVVVLFLSQQFVWIVRVEGCERLEQQQLINALNELGVKRGTLKSGIDVKYVKQNMLLKVSDLAWATLNLRGTTATLVVRERIMPPQKIDISVPANVVAAQDGLIERMVVTDGKAVLKVGDTVCKGEIIVSGVFEDRWGLSHLLRANAEVIAHVPESLEVRVPLKQEKARQTGEVIKRRYLELPGVRLPLFIYTGLEGDYKVETMTRRPKLLGVEIPLDITRESYIFFERDYEEISSDEALRIAQKQLLQKEEDTWGDAVIERNVCARTENGVLVLTGEYIVEKDIARQVEIPLLNQKEKTDGKPPRVAGY